jgi:hypothetical protein
MSSLAPGKKEASGKVRTHLMAGRGERGGAGAGDSTSA